MIVNSQRNGCYQQQCEALLRYFDCSYFGPTSPGIAGTLVIDLGTDLRGIEASCESDDFDLYVELPYSPLEDTRNVEVHHASGDGLSMEAGRTSAVDQRLGLALPYSANRHQGRMSGDVFSCLHGSKGTSAKVEEEVVVSGRGNRRLESADTEKGSVSDEKPQKRRVLGSNRLAGPLNQNFGEVRKTQVSGLSQSPNQGVYELSQKFEGKRLGKRACAVSELDSSKRRKMTEIARVPSSKDDCQSSAKVIEKLTGRSTHWQDDKEKESSKIRSGSGIDTKTGRFKDSFLDSTYGKSNVLHRSRLGSAQEDISREEAALELEQCVSLLRKYGVLKTRDFYLSQNLPGCVPHPGFVGDGLLSKVCKTCGASEDANGTVICDECQESVHMSCCFPRMSSKYFEREDDWYCNSCKKQKKKIGSKVSIEGCSSQGNISSSKIPQSGLVDSTCSVFPVGSNYNSRVRLGPAHQADVPPWTGRVEDNDLETSVADRPGMEVPLTPAEKRAEKDNIQKTFENKIQSLGWIPAKSLPQGLPENWLKCQCFVERELKDSDGRKHSDMVCGKWRRAPLNIEQKDNWECFCAMLWDPLHADCAVPQELSTEEIMKRMQKVGSMDDRASEVFLSGQIT